MGLGPERSGHPTLPVLRRVLVAGNRPEGGGGAIVTSDTMRTRGGENTLSDEVAEGEV